MTPRRVVGMALLVAGILLPILGISAARPPASEAARQAAAWYIAGGIASLLVGVQLLLFGVPGHHAGRG